MRTGRKVITEVFAGRTDYRDRDYGDSGRSDGDIGVFVDRQKSKKCADEIVSTIERTRVLTLGKEQNDVECVLTYEGKEYHAKIYQKGTLVSDRIVGKIRSILSIF